MEHIQYKGEPEQTFLTHIRLFLKSSLIRVINTCHCVHFLPITIHPEEDIRLFSTLTHTFQVYWYTFSYFLHFTMGNNFCDFLFAFLDDIPPHPPKKKWVCSYRKEFAPTGANSFLLRRPLLRMEVYNVNIRVDSLESVPIHLEAISSCPTIKFNQFLPGNL